MRLCSECHILKQALYAMLPCTQKLKLIVIIEAFQTELSKHSLLQCETPENQIAVTMISEHFLYSKNSHPAFWRTPAAWMLILCCVVLRH